jgi:carboxylesterase type B
MYGESEYFFAGHGHDVPYVFHTLRKTYCGKDAKPCITKEDEELEDMMMTNWVNFAHNGNPNTPHAAAHSSLSSYIARKSLEDDGEEWPEFTANKEMRVFNTGADSNVSYRRVVFTIEQL